MLPCVNNSSKLQLHPCVKKILSPTLVPFFYLSPNFVVHTIVSRESASGATTFTPTIEVLVIASCYPCSILNLFHPRPYLAVLQVAKDDVVPPPNPILKRHNSSRNKGKPAEELELSSPTVSKKSKKAKSTSKGASLTLSSKPTAPQSAVKRNLLKSQPQGTFAPVVSYEHENTIFSPEGCRQICFFP